jgi:Lysophospholipase L1 and related esterases
VAAEEGVSLVDLDKEFDGLDKRHLFWDTMHPSDKGNAVIASHLAQEIASMESN